MEKKNRNIRHTRKLTKIKNKTKKKNKAKMRKDKQNGCGKLACSFYELYTMFCVQSRSI